MKQKLILIAGFTLLMLGSTSCKKAWECKCNNGAILNGAVSKSATVFADSNEEALEKCNKKLNKNNDMYCNAVPN
ncbi:MAG TPA: hypothetical protein VL021_03685 [Brumimicrobium sp.]|nr:hypothetical protein [Brumimicrobium sp.]